MNELINQRNANAHTLRYLCANLAKKYKNKLTYISPKTVKGKVTSVEVVFKEPVLGTKVPMSFHLDGADILDSLENIELINFKIQYLCQEEMNTTN